MAKKYHLVAIRNKEVNGLTIVQGSLSLPTVDALSPTFMTNTGAYCSFSFKNIPDWVKLVPEGESVYCTLRDIHGLSAGAIGITKEYWIDFGQVRSKPIKIGIDNANELRDVFYKIGPTAYTEQLAADKNNIVGLDWESEFKNCIEDPSYYNMLRVRLTGKEVTTGNGRLYTENDLFDAEERAFEAGRISKFKYDGFLEYKKKG